MNKLIHCFWTGGWDSTFRVLQLALIEGVTVKPHYLLDRKRKSAKKELQVMQTIREDVAAKFPGKNKLILPLQVKNKSFLRKNRQTRKWFLELDSRMNIGIQYEWMARYAERNGLNDIEVCFTKYDAPLNNLLEKNLVETGHACRIIVPDHEPALNLFKNFRFPTIHLPKKEFGMIAYKHGFLDIMKKTWYCYNPGPNGETCGNCNPCKIADKSGYLHFNYHD